MSDDQAPRAIRKVRCSVCSQEYATNRDGNVRAHPKTGLTWAAGYCAGSGRAPRATEASR